MTFEDIGRKGNCNFEKGRWCALEKRKPTSNQMNI
jgi:hypothetical protein